MLFLPERAIQNITKCDLQTVAERLAFKNGPMAVLHNLQYALLLKDRFQGEHEDYYRYRFNDVVYLYFLLQKQGCQNSSSRSSSTLHTLDYKPVLSSDDYTIGRATFCHPENIVM